MVRSREAPARARGVGEPLGLSDDQLRDIYYKMLVARILGDRMLILNRQGRATFAITGHGHEAGSGGQRLRPQAGHGLGLPYYRDMGVVLDAGHDQPRDHARLPGQGRRPLQRRPPDAQPLRAMPSLRIVTGSSVVATQIPHAVGIALASKLRGEKDATIVYFGEGATSKGDFHEGAELRRRPPAAGGLLLREQWLRHLRAPVEADGHPQRLRAGGRLRLPRRRRWMATTRWPCTPPQRALGRVPHGGEAPSSSRLWTSAWCPTPAPTTTAAIAAARSWRSGQDWPTLDPLSQGYLEEQGLLTEKANEALRARPRRSGRRRRFRREAAPIRSPRRR